MTSSSCKCVTSGARHDSIAGKTSLQSITGRPEMLALPTPLSMSSSECRCSGALAIVMYAAQLASLVLWAQE